MHSTENTHVPSGNTLLLPLPMLLLALFLLLMLLPLLPALLLMLLLSSLLLVLLPIAWRNHCMRSSCAHSQQEQGVSAGVK